jgi:hypothetical protein
MSVRTDTVRFMAQASSPSDFAVRACEGDFEWLTGFADLVDAEQDNQEVESLVYKWLCIAADHGHSEAEEMIEDLLHGSSLAYDDDQFVVGSTHFELGLAYLRGADGLPARRDLGQRHLEAAIAANWPWGVQEADALVAEARRTLDADQRAVFDAVYAPRTSPTR